MSNWAFRTEFSDETEEKTTVTRQQSLLTQDVIHLSEHWWNCVIPNHVNSHSCKYHTFTFKNESVKCVRNFRIEWRKNIFLKIILTGTFKVSLSVLIFLSRPTIFVFDVPHQCVSVARRRALRPKRRFCLRPALAPRVTNYRFNCSIGMTFNEEGAAGGVFWEWYVILSFSEMTSIFFFIYFTFPLFFYIRVTTYDRHYSQYYPRLGLFPLI